MPRTPLTKQQQQFAILAVVGVAILGVMLWSFRGAFVPAPRGTTAVSAPPQRVTVPPADEAALYGRPDFQALRNFGNTPVRPIGSPGNAEPFAVTTE